MNPFEDIEKKLDSTKQKTTLETDERILADMQAEFDRASKVAPAVYSISPAYKIAAAVIIAALIVGAVVFTTRQENTKSKNIVELEPTAPAEIPESPNVPEEIAPPVEIVATEPEDKKAQDFRAEFEHIIALAKAEDVNGLLTALDDTDMPLQMIIANYLSQFGDEHTADILEDLGQKHFPDEPNNFFKLASGKIKAAYLDVTEEINDLNIIEPEIALEEPCEVIAEPNIPLFTLNGYILNEANEPLTSARIRIVAGKTDLETKTDAEGYYEIKGLPGDANLTIIPYKNSYGHNLFHFDPIDSDTTLDIRIFPQAYDWYNKPAPELIVQQWLNCEPFTLADLKGQHILLYLGLSEKGSNPYQDLLEFNKHYFDFNDLSIVAVHEYLQADGNDLDKLYDFIETQQIEVPIAVDADSDLAQGIALEDELHFEDGRITYKQRGLRSGGATHSIYEVRQRPSYYLIDPNGILLKCIGESEIETVLSDFMHQ